MDPDGLPHVTVSSAFAAFSCHGLVRCYRFGLSQSHPLLPFLSRSHPLLPLLVVTISSAFAAVTVSSAFAAFGCHGLVRFCRFWLSRSRPLLPLLAVTVSSPLLPLLSRSRPLLPLLAVTVLSTFTAFGCHGLVCFHRFWLSRSRPLLPVTAFGCHGLVRFYRCWLSRSRLLLPLLAVTVSSAFSSLPRNHVSESSARA